METLNLPLARHCNVTVVPTIVFTFSTPIGTVTSVAFDVESKGERSFATDLIVGSNPKSGEQTKLLFLAKHSVCLFYGCLFVCCILEIVGY